MVHMLKFKATKVSAFLAGFVLSFAVVASDIANKRELVGFTLDSPRMFPFVGMFFFVSVIAFVIGPQMFSIERIPHTGIPKDRAAWTLMAQTWVRMVVWFLGAVVGMFSLILFK
jgi:uncharacterized membrane protein (Fun14 family)